MVGGDELNLPRSPGNKEPAAYDTCKLLCPPEPSSGSEAMRQTPNRQGPGRWGLSWLWQLHRDVSYLAIDLYKYFPVIIILSHSSQLSPKLKGKKQAVENNSQKLRSAYYLYNGKNVSFRSERTRSDFTNFRAYYVNDLNNQPLWALISPIYYKGKKTKRANRLL